MGAASTRAERAAGQAIYGIGVAGLGAMCLLTGDLNAVFQPVPEWVPLARAFADLTGVLLLMCGAALLARKASAASSLALFANFFVVWLVALHAPTVIAKPGSVGNWEGCGLTMTIAAGGWILLALTEPAPSFVPAFLVGRRGALLATRLYALGLPLIGLAHFADAQGSTDYVPLWLPFRVGWVYLTGAAHVAAGLALLVGVLARLAATLEAVQITGFVILTHLPAVYGAPKDQVQWAMLVSAVAIAGTAWLVAGVVAEPAPSDRPASAG